MYSFVEQAIVEKMVILLKPFEIATSILCAENSPTMNKVLPIVAKLSLTVAQDPNNPPIITALKNKRDPSWNREQRRKKSHYWLVFKDHT